MKLIKSLTLFVAVCCVGIFLLKILLFWPLIDESQGYVDPNSNSVNIICLSGHIPANASMYRYIQVSVAIGGRFTAYRFSGGNADLHDHAISEFASHTEGPLMKKSRVQTPPIDIHYIKFLEKSYQCKLDWMLPPVDSKGVEYYADNTKSVYMPPTIFVDELNNTLYYIATD